MPLRSASLTLFAALAAASHADPFSFVNWDTTTAVVNNDPTSHVSGTIPTTNGLIGVTLTGDFTSVYLDDVYNPASTFVGGIVGNQPDIPYNVRIDRPSTFTLAFSKPVTNLAYDLWSVGQPGNSVSYVFTQPFSLVASGPNGRYGGSGLTKSGNTVSGEEGNGTLLFTGTYSAISWNVVGAETYQSFTIGLSNVQTVPEPSTMAALGLGAVVILRRRQHQRERPVR